jgi:AraC-like DNA-binding protein
MQFDRGDFQVRYFSFEPSGHLRSYVQKYYYVEFECKDEFQQCNLPASHAIMCFQIGSDEPTLLYEGVPPFTHRNYFAGPMHSPLYIGSAGRFQALVVLFTELGGYYLFKIPQIEYADRLICLNDFIGASSQKVIAQVHSLQSTLERIQSIEQFLTDFFELKARTLPSLEYAIEKIASTYSNKTLAEICCELPCSLRTLERQFQYYIGTTPKEFARLYRLCEVYKGLMNRTQVSLHDLIHKLGYYDQAHLIRDMKSYAGITPKRFEKHARFIEPYLSEKNAV